MDKQQAQKIVDGLKHAPAASATVVKLEGKEERDFNFVSEDERPCLPPDIEHGLIARETMNVDEANSMLAEWKPGGARHEAGA